MRIEKDNEKNSFVYSLLVFLLGFALAVGFCNDYYSTKLSETALIASNTYQSLEAERNETVRLKVRIAELEALEIIQKELDRCCTDK